MSRSEVRRTPVPARMSHSADAETHSECSGPIRTPRPIIRAASQLRRGRDGRPFPRICRVSAASHRARVSRRVRGSH